jgi:DNA polymerase elongation subunit (family B)
MSVASVSQIATHDPLQMSVNTVEYESFTNYICPFCQQIFTNPLFHETCQGHRVDPLAFKPCLTTKVFLFGRDANRERTELVIDDFIPRFYTLPTDPALVTRRLELFENGVTQITTSPFKDLDENPVLRIDCQTPKQVAGTKWQLGLRSMFESTCQADVKFRTLFLIAMKVFQGIQVRKWDQVVTCADILPILIPSSLRILYFDIEVDSTEDIPSWEYPDQPVTMASFYDNYTGILSSFAWHPRYRPRVINAKYIKKISHKEKSYPWKITLCINEKDMLQQIVSYIKNIDPDLVTGWNIQTFDLPYMKQRCERMDVTFDSISPLQIASILQEKDKKSIGFKIWGRTVFDLLAGYKGMQAHEIQSFKLDKVVDFECHCGTVHSTTSMSELWHRKFKKCLIMNAMHTEACIEIDRKRHVLGFYDDERRFTGCEFEDIMMRSRFIDVTLLREAQDDMTVLPTKPEHPKKEAKSKGAVVFTPKKGKHRIVCGVDMSAFYPSIFIALNASKEMRVKDETILQKLEELHQVYHLLPLMLCGRYPRIPFTRSHNGTWFKNTKDSLVRRTIRKFILRRKDIKKLRDQHFSTKKCNTCSTMEECNEQWSIYNEMQKMYKTRINAMYGVFGYPNFRLHDKPTFASVPDQAKDVLIFSKNLVESKKLFQLLQRKFPSYPITEMPEVIAGDTDSLYIELSKDLSVAQAVEIGKFIISYINKKIRVYILRMHTLPKDFLLKIDLEKVFSPFMLGTQKKRWAGRCRWEDGRFIDKIIKMGFETVRSDTPLVSKGAQDRYIDLFCLNVEDEPILKGIRTIIKRIRKGNFYSIEDIAIPIGVWVDPDEYQLGQKHLPIHIRAILTTKKYWGANYGQGSKILYCYFKPGSLKYNGNTITIVKGKNDVFAFHYAEDIPKEFQAVIDYDLMVDKTMKSELERVFEIANLDWDTFFYNQQSMDQWIKAVP